MTDPRMTPTNDAPVTVEQIAARLIDQTDEPWPQGTDADRLHYWRDKAIDCSNRLAALASAPAESETVSLYREIDALGGTGDGDWHRGYSEALTDVLAILSRRGFSETEVSVASSPAIPAGMVAWHGGNGAPADWDGGPVHYANGITARPLDDGDWQRPADVPLIGYTPRLASTPAGVNITVRQKDPVVADYGDNFLVAHVSADGKTVGIDHPCDAVWSDVDRAQTALRDYINERIAAQDKCPFKPRGNTASAPAGDGADAGKVLDDIVPLSIASTWDDAERRNIIRAMEAFAALAGPRAAVGEREAQPQRRDGKPPCGECRLPVGETCDICGARQ